jgi:hypothetical protein
MDASHAAKPSSQEMEAGFDLLVADVTEYAIFLIGPGALALLEPGAHRIFGYQSAEIIGQHFSGLFSPQDTTSSR